ncbi:MAG: rRNA maturation RNase YbeY [Gammaproteobacteria bacterium]|nr:rRNA maturation RNase YbeY [Gammaproteobacteria bacterium]
MIATVNISNSCAGNWVPSNEQCEDWLNCGLQVAAQSKPCSISLSFIDEASSKSLNNDYRGKNKPTNVLSFPAEFPSELAEQVGSYPLGDIVICPTVVEAEALNQGKELIAHWAHLTIHGLFHLLGYLHDQQSNAAEMEKLEINTLERLGIPNPYLLV